MRRRDFIASIGGAAIGWPLAAHAQQPKLPTIGFLGPLTSSAMSRWTAAFVQRLRELGWIEGRTIVIEYRWGEGRSERFPEIVAEFVRLKVSVIVTGGTAAVIAAKQATSVIPIVFGSVADPVGTGLVASLARPGGNVTGLSNQSADLPGKRLEFLREVVAGLRRLAIMANISNPSNVLEMSAGQAAAQMLGIDVVKLEIRRGEDIVPAFNSLKGDADALYVVTDALVNTNRVRINTLALGARLPTMFGEEGYVEVPADSCPTDQTSPTCTGAPATMWTRFARGEAGRYPGRAANQVRSRRQSNDRQDAWAQDTGGFPAARRYDHRMRVCRRRGA